MKTSTIITILVLILGIHGLVLYLVLRGGGEDDGQKLPENAEVEPLKESAQPPQRRRPRMTFREYQFRQALEAITKPYIYQGAYEGSIPGFNRGKPGRAGIIVDLKTRKVLWSKGAHKAVPIASMTKLMTVLVAYEMVMDKKNGLTLETPVKVSVAAYKIGGSQVYLDPRETFSIGELMMAASIQSANDAAYLIAEFLGGGDVNLFVQKMNAKAAQLGMKNTIFRNPHGLPGKNAAEDNVSSPEDMLRLAEATLLYPQLMKWASTWKAPFRKPGTKGYIEMRNHNHLIPGARTPSAGVDGLKTGFIARSGYCLAFSCNRGGRRVIGVVMGHPTWKERDRFVAALLDWGYRQISRQGQVFGNQ